MDDHHATLRCHGFNPLIISSFLFDFSIGPRIVKRKKGMKEFGPFLDLVRNYEAQDEDFLHIGPL